MSCFGALVTAIALAIDIVLYTRVHKESNDLKGVKSNTGVSTSHSTNSGAHLNLFVQPLRCLDSRFRSRLLDDPCSTGSDSSCRVYHLYWSSSRAHRTIWPWHELPHALEQTLVEALRSGALAFSLFWQK